MQNRNIKIFEGGQLVGIIERPNVEFVGPARKSIVKPVLVAKKTSRFAIGTNQYKSRLKSRRSVKKPNFLPLGILLGSMALCWGLSVFSKPVKMISPIPESQVFAQEKQATKSAAVKVVHAEETKPSPTPTPEPEKETELVEVVAYIAKVFEPEGKDVVVQAINCFYSESGLREKAVGQNTDKYRSRDHGVAQLNDHWHNLTEAEKTQYKANIDKAYQIYKGRGGNFSAWYGKRCN